MIVPVVIFTFNRPQHLSELLSSLSLNPEAQFTELIIYLDGPRHTKDAGLIVNSLTIIDLHRSEFKDIEVIQRKTNFGSSKNISNGITDQFRRHTALIILEDDLLATLGRQVALLLGRVIRHVGRG